MTNRLSQNLKLLRKHKGYTQAEMQAHTGISGATWSNYEKGPENGGTEPDVESLLKIAKFFKVTTDHLIQGNFEKGNLILNTKSEGNPQRGNLNSKGKGNLSDKKGLLRVVEEDDRLTFRMPQVITVDSAGQENIVMVPVRASAGYLRGYSDPEFMSTLPVYRLPGLNNGTFRMFEVGGLSMYDTLHDHDIIIGSYVDQLRDVRDDRVHVVVTKNDGVVVKRVLNRIKTDGKLILKSDNYKDRDMYPPIICDQQDIIEIWYGIAYMSRQMKPPAEMYKRLIDLEGRFTLLEGGMKKLD